MRYNYGILDVRLTPVHVRVAASQTLGVFFVLPYVYPPLFSSSNESDHMFAKRLYELAQIVFLSCIEDADVTRAEFLGHQLLAQVPVLFADFGQKPKFHYAFAHIGTTLRRHGPSPYWSSFSFESRLGDLKRACLLVANNHGVAQRGADLVLETFAVRTRACRLSGPPTVLVDFLMQQTAVTDDMRQQLAAFERSGAEMVRDVIRYEGSRAAFNRGSFVAMPHLTGDQRGEWFYAYVSRMCRVLGAFISINPLFFSFNLIIR